MLLVKAPVASTAPSFVWKSEMVGPVEVFHTIPCWVIADTPRFVTLPLPVAVVLVILVTACVVTVGSLNVVKFRIVPLVVPPPFTPITW